MGIRRQGELRYKQQSAGDVLNGEIHFSRSIRKHTITQHTLQQTIGVRMGITPFDANERQQTVAD